MKSFEQLAQSAYEAYVKAFPQCSQPMPSWESLGPVDKNCFVSVAKQLWAEFAPIH